MLPCNPACCLAWLTPACLPLQYAFGRVGGLWVVLPSQLIVLIGLGITYTVTGGQSLMRFYDIVCTKNEQGQCTSFVSLWQQPAPCLLWPPACWACTGPSCSLLCSGCLFAHAPRLSGLSAHASCCPFRACPWDAGHALLARHAPRVRYAHPAWKHPWCLKAQLSMLPYAELCAPPPAGPLSLDRRVCLMPSHLDPGEHSFPLTAVPCPPAQHSQLQPLVRRVLPVDVCLPVFALLLPHKTTSMMCISPAQGSLHCHCAHSHVSTSSSTMPIDPARAVLQLPNFHSLTFMSLIAAFMSMSYSTIAFGGSLNAGQETHTSERSQCLLSAEPLQLAFNSKVCWLASAVWPVLLSMRPQAPGSSLLWHLLATAARPSPLTAYQPVSASCDAPSEC